MNKRKVKDLMIPLSEYAVVPENATLMEAITELDKAILKLPPGRQKHRAVLVADSNKKIVGKIGHQAFLKALEPKYKVLGDRETLDRVGLQDEFVESMMQHYQYFQDDLSDLCSRASNMKARDVMHHVSESVDEDDSLAEGAHKLIINHALSILVIRDEKVVGVLRISDLFEELTSEMKRLAEAGQ